MHPLASPASMLHPASSSSRSQKTCARVTCLYCFLVHSVLYRLLKFFLNRGSCIMRHATDKNTSSFHAEKNKFAQCQADERQGIISEFTES